LQIEFLGTGGAITAPRPGCDCRVCGEAREKGVPYSRTGPCVFVHGPDVLIDTPEEIKLQLNRSRVEGIAACFYSHWHPDHTMGRRVWEMNRDWRRWPRRDRRTDIYLPQRVAHDFRERLGIWEHLSFFAERNLVRIIELDEGEAVELGGFRIVPVPLAEDYVYAFLFEGAGKRALVVADEIKGWIPPPEVLGADVAVVPMGVVEFDPFTGARRIAEDHPVLGVEATFRQTLEIVRKLEADRVVMTHIEEPDGLTYDDLKRIENESGDSNIAFAYDTLLVEV
jgi:phosphoribosyl 1,2-cyclic phosphate phosphodiesterase